MTHAMVLTGVDLDEAGRPLKWRLRILGEIKSEQMATLLLLTPGWTNTPTKSLSAKELLTAEELGWLMRQSQSSWLHGSDGGFGF